MFIKKVEIQKKEEKGHKRAQSELRHMPTSSKLELPKI